MEDSVLFDEANWGHLQSYIDGESKMFMEGEIQTYFRGENRKINDALRQKWCLQTAEAIAYVHEKGIIHSNLSTTNVLVN
jgi:serine/threonine protein kinase